MKKVLKKISKSVAVASITAMCVGCLTVVASTDSTIIKNGSTVSLDATGTSLQHFVTISNAEYARTIGANYSWKEIKNNKTAYRNYVKTTVRYKNKAGDWKKYGTVNTNMIVTGRIYCPRINDDRAMRVYGIRCYASNNYSDDSKYYGQTATCSTSLSQGYVYSE